MWILVHTPVTCPHLRYAGRTLRRRLKKDAKLYIRIEATVGGQDGWVVLCLHCCTVIHTSDDAVLSTPAGRYKCTSPAFIPLITLPCCSHLKVPVTRKPEGIRMGKGKGAIAFYATPVRSKGAAREGTGGRSLPVRSKGAAWEGTGGRSLPVRGGGGEGHADAASRISRVGGGEGERRRLPR